MRPNNGFLKQLLRLEKILQRGVSSIWIIRIINIIIINFQGIWILILCAATFLYHTGQWWSGDASKWGGESIAKSGRKGGKSAISFPSSFKICVSLINNSTGQLVALKDSSALWKTNWRNPLRGEMAVKPLWITQQKKSEKCLNNQMFDVLDDCSNGDDTKWKPMIAALDPGALFLYCSQQSGHQDREQWYFGKFAFILTT